MEQNRVVRPWGWYCSVFESASIKIKTLYVNPNQRLSLQRHRFRAEHWYAIEGSGVALVENDGVLESRTLRAGGSVDIAMGTKHRLSGGSSGILIVEVQTGTTLSEDDIERFEDDFGRA
jgi:mannose-6-phosphate isomerase-like protein (cupin superfamily)